MRTINYKELDGIYPLDYGGYSYTYTTNLDNKTYCYKEFKTLYDVDIMNNIKELTDTDFIKELITPKYLVDCNRNWYLGYLSNYYGKLMDIDSEHDINKLISMLKESKKLIEILHNYYKRIHCDINKANVVYRESDNKCFIIDFDRSLKIGQEPMSNMSMLPSVINYLKYHKFDYLVDVYSFNSMTLSVLCNTEYVFELNKSKDVKRLSKELLPNNIDKKISGEYIIDYIN